MQQEKDATTICHPMIVKERTIKLKDKSGQKNISINHYPIYSRKFHVNVRGY